MGPLEEGIEWEAGGVSGVRRFLDRVWRLAVDTRSGAQSNKLTKDLVDNKVLERALHSAIKKVTAAIENLRFNTAISEMMVFVNEATKAKQLPIDWLEKFLLILSPFAPHLSEEIWEQLGHLDTMVYANWPDYDEAKLTAEQITIAVQVMGKLRATIDVPADKSAS